MRRMHWWGAAAGVGALAVAAVGVPSAFALQSQKPPSQQKTVAVSQVKSAPAPAIRGAKTPVRQGNNRGAVSHGRWNRFCPEYPPHGRPDVAIGGQSRARKGSTIQITGAVKINGCGYENQKTGLFKRVPGGNRHEVWRLVAGPVMTDKGGNVKFSVSVMQTSQFRVFTAPAQGLAPGASNGLTVKVLWHGKPAKRR
jgi:hypothetical protein